MRSNGLPILGLAIAAAGCNAIFGLAPSTRATDGAVNMDGQPAAGFDAPYSAGCRGSAGPEPVNIDGMFCIDSTQVTNAQYAAFASSVTPATAAQAVGCDTNETFAPASGLLMDNLPVVSVNYCDAWAYCRWAGKRLCANVDGSTAYEDLTTGEMYYVCAGTGKGMNLAYAYGDTYDSNACDDMDPQVTAVKSHPDCHSLAYPAVFDLSANVGFWENMCSPSFCRDTTPQGGQGAMDSHRCDNSNGDPTTLQHPEIGIRCCSDVIHPG